MYIDINNWKEEVIFQQVLVVNACVILKEIFKIFVDIVRPLIEISGERRQSEWKNRVIAYLANINIYYVQKESLFQDIRQL